QRPLHESQLPSQHNSTQPHRDEYYADIRTPRSYTLFTSSNRLLRSLSARKNSSANRKQPNCFENVTALASLSDQPSPSCSQDCSRISVSFCSTVLTPLSIRLQLLSIEKSSSTRQNSIACCLIVTSNCNPVATTIKS